MDQSTRLSRSGPLVPSEGSSPSPSGIRRVASAENAAPAPVELLPLPALVRILEYLDLRDLAAIARCDKVSLVTCGPASMRAIGQRGLLLSPPAHPGASSAHRSRL